MRLSGKLGACCATLVMIVSTLGCTQGPLGSPTPTTSASPIPTASSTPSPSRTATPTAPIVVQARLATESMPVRILAMSGEHVLVQGDLIAGPAIYRISHDSGRTWADASFPCADVDGCDVVPPGSNRVGRTVGGVVTAYAQKAGRLDAYSLPDNAPVGSPYSLRFGEDVYDMAGGLALLLNSVTGAYSVHSLLDGTDRAVVLPQGSAHRLFDDGSVLVSQTGAGKTWLRVAPDGSTATVFASARGTGDVFVNGNVVWLQFSGGRKPQEYCTADVVTGATSCRTGVTVFDHVYGIGSTGAVIAGFANKRVVRYWLPYDGRLGAPRTLASMNAWDPGWPYSAEAATPVVAAWTRTASTLVRPAAAGVQVLPLAWAIRAVLPNSLGLGADAVVGSFASHSRSLSWARSLSATAIGNQRRLGGTGDVAASGALWALHRLSGGLEVWKNGRVVNTLKGFDETSGLAFAGSALLGRPLCRQAPLDSDDDCEGSAVLAETGTGRPISVPAWAEDAHDSLLVYRGGDHTVSSTTFVVIDYRDATVAPITLDLPDPDTGGYYTDVRIRGDWIGATQHLPDGTMHPVLADFRTARVQIGAENARLLGLGDGIAVSALAHTTTVQVWEFTTGATQTLAAASTVVAVDGTRLAYTSDGALVVADFAG